jgi:MYXO-CTERM domain-containing protein
MGRAFGCFLSLLAVLASPVRAHAPPQVLQVLEAPGRIVLSRFEPEPDFKIMCPLALAIGSAEAPELALLEDGTMVAATSTGLQRSRDGCSWDFAAEFGEQIVSALGQDPVTRETLYAATFENNGGAIHVSHDGGQSFEKLTDSDVFVHQLVPAPSRGERIYSVIQPITGGAVQMSVSEDSGASWELRAAPQLSTEGGLELLAVSPSDPDFVLAKGLDNDPVRLLDRVLVSRDGGRSFASPLSVKMLFDASFGADGTIWIAGIEGLWRSDDGAATFTALAGPTRMSCVLEREDALLGCGFYADLKDGIGISTDRGASFSTLFEFTSITEPITCADGTPTARACELLWTDWQREILGIWDAGAPPVTTTDAGDAPDAAEVADAGKRSTRSDGCACSTTPGSGESAPLGLTLTLLALPFAKCTRRARRARARAG